MSLLFLPYSAWREGNCLIEFKENDMVSLKEVYHISVYITTDLLSDVLNCVVVLFNVKCYTVCNLTHFVFQL